MCKELEKARKTQKEGKANTFWELDQNKSAVFYKILVEIEA